MKRVAFILQRTLGCIGVAVALSVELAISNFHQTWAQRARNIPAISSVSGSTPPTASRPAGLRAGRRFLFLCLRHWRRCRCLLVVLVLAPCIPPAGEWRHVLIRVVGVVLVASPPTAPSIKESPLNPSKYLMINNPSVSGSTYPSPSTSMLRSIPQDDGVSAHAEI